MKLNFGAKLAKKIEYSKIMEENSTENSYKRESNDFKPKTEDEVAKERKSRKWELIAGAVGDMGSALANLFFSTKGAPSTISASGKNRQVTLMDKINRRHKEEDEAYGKKLSAWEKEQKRLEKERKADEREDIHPDFKPLKSQWNSKDYISHLYNDLISEVEARNKGAKGKVESPLQAYLLAQANQPLARARPYVMQSVLYSALDGSLEDFDEIVKNELDDEFLSNFRKKWAENSSEGGWEKMK